MEITIFDDAKRTADPDCPQCQGKGTYMYDHNHGTICDLCCQHGKGWWQLTGLWGKNNGKWCCKSGCGKMITEEELLLIRK